MVTRVVFIAKGDLEQEQYQSLAESCVALLEAREKGGEKRFEYRIFTETAPALEYLQSINCGRTLVFMSRHMLREAQEIAAAHPQIRVKLLTGHSPAPGTVEVIRKSLISIDNIADMFSA